MTSPGTVRADQLGARHLQHLIRVPVDGGTRDMLLVDYLHDPGHTTTVTSPGRRQQYTLRADDQVQVLADVSGGRR